MAKRTTVKERLMIQSDGHVIHKKGAVSEHVDSEWDICSDTIDALGRRHLILEEKDLSPYYTKVDKAVELILQKLGEGESKTTKGLLQDVLRDYTEKAVDDVIKKLEQGKPAKIREGCYKLLIGDGRRRNSIELMLRE